MREVKMYILEIPKVVAQKTLEIIIIVIMFFIRI